jgi:hypothetical protein
MEREVCEHSTKMERAKYVNCKSMERAECKHSMNVERGVWEHSAGIEKQGTNAIRAWNDHNPACAFFI